MSDDPTIREGQGRRRRVDTAADARYQPVREIARGGMGRVVEAFDTKLARTVALKEILDEHPDARGRFEREVAITARLEHPSIVPLYDAGTSSDGSPFYVMRKVSGAPLDTLIRGATTLDQRLRLLPHVLALADAVAHAHVRGVIHRDLKPSNVLVGELGETVVIDWGLAKLIGDRDEPSPGERAAGASLRTVAGTVFGTPGFMSPEQDAGEEVDERTDVYALGACLYHVLAGKPPHDRAPLDVPGAPPDLVTIVGKAMAHDRDARYLDAGGFGEDLRRFLGGQLVAAHHYPLHARLGRWLRRHQALVVVAGLALAATVVVGVYSLRRVFAEQERAEAAARRELARADDLLLFKASSYLASDATLAAATLQQLPADSARWAELGPMVAGIRAAGVAYSYPTRGGVITHAELAPGVRDERLLVWGIGYVRIIDLAARTVTSVDEESSVSGGKWCGTQVIVYRRAGTSELYDPATRARQPAPWQGQALACTPDGAVFALDDTRLSVFDPTTKQTFPIATPVAVTKLTPSSSGSWLVAAGNNKVHVLRAGEGFAFVEALPVLDAPNPLAAFNHDETRLAISSTLGTVEYDLTTSPPTQLRRWNVKTRGILVYIGTDLRWSLLGASIERFADDAPRFYSTGHGIMPHVDLGGREAILVDEKHVVVASATERLTLGVSAPVDRLHGRRDGRFLVAAGPGRVLVWDLDEILPRRSIVDASDGLAFGGRQLYLFKRAAEGLVLDRVTLRPDLVVEGAVRQVLPHMADPIAYEDAVIAIDRQHGWAEIVQPTLHRIPGNDVTAVDRLDANVFVVGTRSGTLQRIDRAAKPLGAVADVGFPIIGLRARAGWIIALSEDGVLWRRAPTGDITRSKLPLWLTPWLAPDGVAYIGRGNELYEWPLTGEPVRVATFPSEPAIRHVTANEVLVDAKGGALHRVDRRTRATTVMIASSQYTAVAAASGVAASLVDGGIVMSAPGGKTHRLVERLPVLPEALALSDDGSLLVAAVRVDGRTHLHVWRLGLGDPRAWIERATNAIAPERPDAAVLWR